LAVDDLAKYGRQSSFWRNRQHDQTCGLNAGYSNRLDYCSKGLRFLHSLHPVENTYESKRISVSTDRKSQAGFRRQPGRVNILLPVENAGRPLMASRTGGHHNKYQLSCDVSANQNTFNLWP